MGKGDKKTRRGKLFRGTYGNSRRRKKKNPSGSSQNMDCYLSHIRLSKSNMTLEHIIPNAFGGKLKSYHLITKDINETYGKTIDKRLIELIPLSTLLTVKRDRGQNPNINAQNVTGDQYLVGEDKTVTRKPIEPIKTKLEDGSTSIKFIKGQEEEILKSLKKKSPHLDINELREQIKWTSSNDDTSLFFNKPLTLVTDKDALRAICKIITNFYVFSAKESSKIQPIIPFIKGETENTDLIKYYYPLEYTIQKLNDDEISHLLYIKGSKAEKLIYGYIELFSCYNLLVVLNDNYSGDDFEYKYCYDLNTNRKLDKEVSLSLTKQDIKKMKFPIDENTEDGFRKRVTRALELKDHKPLWKINSQLPTAHIRNS